MSSADNLARQYRNIHFLPSRELLIVGIMALGIVQGVVIYTIAGGVSRVLLGFIDGLISLAIGSALSAVFLRSLVKEEILTFKRLMAMVIVGMFLLGIGLAASSLVASINGDLRLLEKGYFVSCAILSSYTFIILSSTTKKSAFQLTFLAILQPVIIILLHTIVLSITNNISLLNINFVTIFLVMVAASIFLSRLYFNSIANVGKELIGYSTILILQGFLDALVLDKTGIIENVLKALAEESDVEIKTFEMFNGSQRAMVVAPFFHPGPFRDIGSSRLPTRIAVEFLRKTILPVVFHTPTTHERDLILKTDCDRVVATVLSEVKGPESGSAYPMASVKDGNITITAQIFDEIPLAVISRAPLPTEDLPEYVNTFCMEKLAKKGYSDGAIVDAHNSMVANFTDLSEEDKVSIAKSLEEVLDRVTAGGKGVLKAGFSNVSLEDYSIKDGIGQAGIMVMVTEVNGVKGALVSVDGNNMIVGLRDKIKDALGQIGYGLAEITTTDTHVVTGHTSGEGYFPLGKCVPEKYLIEKIVKAVGLADSRKAECSVKFSKRKVEGVYLLGDRGLENLWKVTNDSFKVAKMGVFVLSALLIVTGVLLYYLL